LGINSYEVVQIVCEVEDVFGVEIPDRAIGGFKTVGDVLGWIERCKEEG
jgi:acyl carrier protein